MLLADFRLLRAFTVLQRVRLRQLKAEVDTDPLLGGEHDGVLTAEEQRWLSFIAYVRLRDCGVDPQEHLDPKRAQELLDGVMDQIQAMER